MQIAQYENAVQDQNHQQVKMTKSPPTHYSFRWLYERKRQSLRIYGIVTNTIHMIKENIQYGTHGIYNHNSFQHIKHFKYKTAVRLHSIYQNTRIL